MGIAVIAEIDAGWAADNGAGRVEMMPKSVNS